MSDERAEAGRPVRLQKYLSRAGVASRREGERLIEGGRVSVDGTVVTELGTQVRPGEQEVRVDGRPVEPAVIRWIAMYKPTEVVTTRGDEYGRRTVYSLLPRRYSDLFYVGRLDRMTEGLLLFTNEGDVAHRLTHPSYEVPRRYRVEVAGPVGRDVVGRLKRGVELEDGIARAEDVEVLEAAGAGAGPGGTSVLRFTLREGRTREVRRMMERVGRSVSRLVRESFGPIGLGELKPGEWRDLTEEEVQDLRAAVGLREGHGDT